MTIWLFRAALMPLFFVLCELLFVNCYFISFKIYCLSFPHILLMPYLGIHTVFGLKILTQFTYKKAIEWARYTEYHSIHYCLVRHRV